MRKQKKIGSSKQVAEHALAQLQVKIAKGEYLGFHEEKKLTFRQFAPEYLAYLGRDAVREGMELLDSISGPTEIRTRVSAVRGQRPWPLDDGALPLEQFPGQGFEPRFYGPEPHVLPVGRPRSDRRRIIPGTRQPQLVGKASVNIISFFHSSRHRTRKDQQPSCSR